MHKMTSLALAATALLFAGTAYAQQRDFSAVQMKTPTSARRPICWKATAAILRSP